MITLAQYWMGRDIDFARELHPYIADNAKITVDRANKFLNAFYTAWPAATTRTVNSGWRPPSVNAMTRNASRSSLHMTGEAVDLSDDDEALDNYAQSPAGLIALAQIGLWLESPNFTARYTHLQIRPPKSGNRVFYP